MGFLSTMMTSSWPNSLLFQIKTKLKKRRLLERGDGADLPWLFERISSNPKMIPITFKSTVALKDLLLSKNKRPYLPLGAKMITFRSTVALRDLLFSKNKRLTYLLEPK